MRQHLALIRTCCAILGLELMCGGGGLALSQWVARNENRAMAVFEDPIPLSGNLAEEIAAIYDGVFHGTVYYTPTEASFTSAVGFDMSPVTRPGLKGRMFPLDFLKSVEMEGFGRMRTPVDGKWYVSSCRGNWDYASSPLDSKGIPLQPLRSTAIGLDHELVCSQANFRVQADDVPPSFLRARWEVCDTGSGLKPGQIDFYWGEDAPLGPGAKLSQPRGMPNRIVNPIVLVLR
jgi:hypothetical protein